MIDIAPIKARLERLDAAVEDAASTGMMRITPELMGARQAFQVNAVNDVRLLLAEIESMRALQVVTDKMEDLASLPKGAVIIDAEKDVCEKIGRTWQTIGLERDFNAEEVALPALVVYVPEGVIGGEL